MGIVKVYSVCGEVFCWPINRWAWACEKLDFDDTWKSESASKFSAITFPTKTNNDVK